LKRKQISTIFSEPYLSRLAVWTFLSFWFIANWSPLITFVQLSDYSPFTSSMIPAWRIGLGTWRGHGRIGLHDINNSRLKKSIPEATRIFRGD